MSLWRGGGYNPERGSLSSYLMLLTRSRALDKLRARGRKLKMVERVGQVNLGEPSGVTPLERATVDECCERVREAVASLPLKERQVLELSVFGGLSYPQIAAQTGTRWAPSSAGRARACCSSKKTSRHSSNSPAPMGSFPYRRLLT